MGRPILAAAAFLGGLEPAESRLRAELPAPRGAFGASIQLSAVSFQLGPPEDRRPICVYLRPSAAHMIFREFSERPPQQPGG